MAYHFNDNVYTRSFTPREPNVELLDSACERNIIICLCNSSRKTFIATKLIQDVINKIDIEKKTVTLYVADFPSVIVRQAACIRRLTDLNVREFTDVNIHTKKMEWKESIKDQQVIVLTTSVAIMLFKQKLLTMAEINLIILHGCHSVLKANSNPMKEACIKIINWWFVLFQSLYSFSVFLYSLWIFIRQVPLNLIYWD